MKVDHILIRVDNLEKTVTDFKEMGFKVYYGNHKKNCHHAMIYFEDGSFLEFIDQSKFPSIFKFLAKVGILKAFGIFFSRFSMYCISKERFLDFAVFSDSIDQFYQKSKNVSKLMKMKRKNHLNQIVTWKLFAFNNLNLPFVMSEYEPTRFPDEGAFIHSNDVIGLDQICIKVPNSRRYLSEWNECFESQTYTDNLIELDNSTIILEDVKDYRIFSITLRAKGINQQIVSRLNKYNIGLS